MKTLLHSFLLPGLLCLPWSSSAQDRGNQLTGDRHIYKTAGEIDLPLYVYNPPGHRVSQKTPAIVFFFGGGWRNGRPNQFEPHCKHLAERGMVAITVDYRVSSKHDVKVEDCIADARSAMRWVRGNARKLGIDPDMIAAGGGSAGGHLAAMVGLTAEFDAATDDKTISAEPNLLVLFNPALAIAPDDALPAAYNDAIGPRLKGRSHGPIAKASPLTYASAKQAPCIMFFGTADDLLTGAEAYRKASVAAGNDCLIVSYSGEAHGFFNHGKKGDVFFDYTVAQMDAFLGQHKFLKPAVTPKAPPAPADMSFDLGDLRKGKGKTEPLPLAPPKKESEGF